MEGENSKLLSERVLPPKYNHEVTAITIESNVEKPPRKMSWDCNPIRMDWSNPAKPVFDSFSLESLSVQSLATEPPLIIKENILTTCLNRFPGLIIVVILNLFFSISFGNAFFPSTWEFPPEVPRSIGIQMFLFSTSMCQAFMTSMSEFPAAHGMQMVENIPFMHTIANVAIKHQGMGLETFSTVFVAFALSSIIVGIFFFILGYFKLGNTVYYFPRHLIIGCIGGIGIFLILTSIEISTSIPWEWTIKNLHIYFNTPPTNTSSSSQSLHTPPYQLALATIGFEIILKILKQFTDLSMLPPFYFIAIPPVFYLILLPIRYTHPHLSFNDWFFPTAPSTTDVFLIWKLIDFRTVNWTAIVELIPTIISLTIFSLMHVPINIPSLSLSTDKDVDMNKEMIAHGYSNIITGCLGGLQNYLCYCNSLLYFKCKGGGKVSGFLLSAITMVFFCIGPSIISYVPRCMAGCVIMHMGTELTLEALVDSFHTFDIFEYLSVLLITVVMTAYGMTAGLAVGILNAAFTFTLQNSKHVTPIKGYLRASSLRSSRWRDPHAVKVLEATSKHILVVQLQGQLFFANAILASSNIQNTLTKSDSDIWYLILDFTQVLGIDSSAADRLAKLVAICRQHRVKVVYSRGSRKGFPCAAPLTDQLLKLERESIKTMTLKSPKTSASPSTVSGDVHVADSLDDALAWCEDGLIDRRNSLLRNIPSEELNVPSYLRHFYMFCGDESEDVKDKLFSYFSPVDIPAGTTLWRQGDVSDRALLLAQGRLVSHVAGEEDTTTEVVDAGDAGFVLGEFGLLTGTTRRSTVRAVTNVSVFALTKSQFEVMLQRDPYLAFILSRICMTYLDHRVQHVANRIWGNHSVPI